MNSTPLLLRLKRAALWAGGGVVGLLLLLTLAVHFGQDAIISQVIAELNKSLQTRIDIARIEVSLWRHFPRLSVSCQTVKVHGSLPADKTPLARAANVELLFGIGDLLGDDIAIGQAIVTDADVRLLIDAAGNPNYEILKKTPKTPGQPGEVRFDLRRVRLENVRIRYTDVPSAQDHQLLAQQADARLLVRNSDYRIHLDGDLHSDFLRVDGLAYLADKQLRVSSEMQYDYAARRLLIQPSQLFVNGSEFEVMGYHMARPHSFVDLQFAGKRTNAQTLLSLLPESLSKAYAAYQSKGEVYFKGAVIGYTEGRSVPKVDVQFGCRNASFYESKLNKRIEGVNLTGRFGNGDRQTRATSSLTLENVTGRLDNRPFAGNLTIRNFDRPHLAFAAKGTFDMATVTAFVPSGIRNGAGLLTADVQFEGNLNDLRQQNLNRFVRTSGNLQLQNVAFTLPQRPLRLHNLNGDFSFRNTDLMIHRFSGAVGRSDFRLNGRFENILAYLLLNDQALRVVADFNARQLDFDELLAETPAGKPATASSGYRLRLSPRLDLNLACRVDALRFRRFRARQVRGDFTLRDGIARSNDIRLQTANGSMNLRLGVDASQPTQVRLSTNAQFDGIRIDSVFYMFEDFGQDFIRSQHLRGKVNARVQTFLAFDEHFNPDHDRTVAEVFATVRDGQLVGFEPMQKLSGFINRRELANMRFGEMQNNIHIEKRTVFLPLMEINSNVANISVQGSHTFDNVMDYRFRIPVKTLFQKRTLQASTRPVSTQPSLHLRIHGPADNYKISYDSKRESSPAPAETPNLRQALRKPENESKTRPTVSKQPATETYFDF
ncbi:MAG: hypothetical protein MUD08_15430 [Cytophagales bacterium]|nr:hypothetical protein [Cytophagales bacterium]